MQQISNDQFSNYNVQNDAEEAEDITFNNVNSQSQIASQTNFVWTEEAKQEYESKRELFQQISDESEKMSKMIKKLGREGKLMSVEEALKNPPKNDINDKTELQNLDPNFAMGAIAKTFQEIGLKNVAIAKDPIEDEKMREAANQMLVNTDILAGQDATTITFDFGENRNNELNYDQNKREEFFNNLRKEWSLKTGIPENEIMFLTTNEEDDSESVSES